MYKININENTLYLMSSDDLQSKNSADFALIVSYTGKSKSLFSYIDMLEKTNHISDLVIHYHDYKQLKLDFLSLYKVIKASGGVVEDENSRVLMIFRRGFWDLPKGKIEEGETKKHAAIREVMEETGISNIDLSKKVATTRHSYKLKSGKRALKVSYWYLMHTMNQPLVPQSSEDIEKAKWVNPKVFLTKDLPIYSNIVEILKKSGHI